MFFNSWTTASTRPGRTSSTRLRQPAHDVLGQLLPRQHFLGENGILGVHQAHGAGAASPECERWDRERTGPGPAHGKNPGEAGPSGPEGGSRRRQCRRRAGAVDHVGPVGDGVAVALFREKQLSVMGEIQLARVAGGRACKSGRPPRRPSDARSDPAAGLPPGGSRTCPTPGSARWRPANRGRNCRPSRGLAATASPAGTGCKDLPVPGWASAPVMSGMPKRLRSCRSCLRYWPIISTRLPG